MREILFRGKRKDNGRWIQGDYQHFHIENDIYVYIGRWGEEMRSVKPETVGQLTGLTDKNGNQIFEGDILEFRRGRTHIVKFEDGAFIFTDTAIPVRYADKFEVIGNIHDNPELL
jgi:uncharacterized phage protein (TIGR01671 family)